MKTFGTLIRSGAIIFLVACGCKQSRPLGAPTGNTAQEQFHWLDTTRDSQVWNRVQTAFAQELQPDDPTKLKSHEAGYNYKYIQQIGVFRDAVLVILGHRLDKGINPYDDWFSSYSYDLSSGVKRQIFAEDRHVDWNSDALYQFKILKLVRFERSPGTPDIAFTYDDCAECEPGHFLASFEYSSEEHRWNTRQWDNKKSVLLMEEPTPDDDAVSFDYLYKIKDWDGDGLDEVAVRRREVTQAENREQTVDDTTVFYKAENGTIAGHYLYSNERATTNAELCRDSLLSFCHE